MSDVSQRLLIVFVDALGPAQFQRFGDRLGFLPHQRTLRGILGYSSGALPTILTGAPPSVHGRMCLFSRNDDDAEGILAPLSILGLLPRIVHEREWVRRQAASWLTKHCGISGYVALHRVPPEAFHWLDIPEREDMFQAESIGRARTFLADARQCGLAVYTANWRLPETPRWQAALSTIAQQKPDLTFLYSTELDAHLHEVGNDALRTDEVLSRIARRIGRARELLSNDGRPLVTVVIGDHGMADVTRTIDPRPLASQLHIEQAIVDSTMWRFWGDDSALSTTRKSLESSSIPGSWLDLRALRARGNPVVGTPFGQALWLLPEGSIFAPSWVGNKARGMHGYDVGTQSSLAVLASDDTSIGHCNALTDLAPLVRKHFGLGLPKAVNA
jgi:Type I phosphodiesterase / nucleotide pyrophosphatase